MESELIPPRPAKYDRVPAIRNLRMIRDMQLLALDDKMSEPARQDFVQFFRNLRSWAKSNGLIGAKIGFLDSNNLIWLVHSSCMEERSSTPSNLVDNQGEYRLAAVFKRFKLHLRHQGISDNLQELLHGTSAERRVLKDNKPSKRPYSALNDRYWTTLRYAKILEKPSKTLLMNSTTSLRSNANAGRIC